MFQINATLFISNLNSVYRAFLLNIVFKMTLKQYVMQQF